MNLLEIVSLSKVYHNGKEKVHALKEVSFSLQEKDYIAVVGPSGSGKSTLLHIMGGIDMPTKGKVLFKGQDLYRKKDGNLAFWRSKTVGFVFQFYHLIEELNVLENIAIAAYVDFRKTSLKRAEELLKYLDIAERRNFFPSQLSGGEKQKVAIARALVNDPQIILCDEPTGNLDKDSQDKVVELIEKLNQEKKKTVIIVTHNLELAKRAKRVIALKSGELVA
jgi:putative ABC transport system ATP-binding protein